MAILARGSLSERPMSLVFGSLSRRGFSGELVVRAGAKYHRVGWQDGAVIAAESPHPADSAVKLGLTLGMISSTQAGEISQVLAGDPGRDELDVVGQVARLPEEVLGRLARRVVGARAARALAPTEGEMIVSDEVPTGPRIIPIDARWILYTGVRNHFTLERLEREVIALATAIRLRADSDLSGFGFGAVEEDLLHRLQDGELAIDRPPPDLDAQILYAVALALIATGECEIVHGGAARAPARPSAATSGRMAAAGTYSSGRLPTTPVGSTGRVPVATTPPAGGSGPAPTHAQPSPAISTHPTPRSMPRPPSQAIPSQAIPGQAQAIPTQPSQAVPTQPRVSRTTTGPQPPMVGRTATGPVPPMVARAPTPTGSHQVPMISRTATPLRDPLPPMLSRAPTPMTNLGRAGSLPTGATRSAMTPGRGVPITGATTSRTTTSQGDTVPPPSGHATTPAAGRTGAMPRKRTPTTDDATAIRALIVERLALLAGDADHYVLLGIERAADATAIRAAYFELARLLHPDRLSALGISDDDRAAQRLFARINDAFTVLSTAPRRAEYDTLLDAGGARAVAEREAAAGATATAAVEAEERYRLGEMAMRRQQAEIAVHEFQRAVELKPDEPDYITLLGWALYVAARDKVAAVTVARMHIHKALTMKKETALPHLYLGRIARMEGEDDEAARSFRRALEIAPTNSEAQAELRVVEARRRAKPSTRGGLFSRLGKKP